MKTKTMMAVMAALLLTLALASAAFAQSSQDGYIQEGPSVVDQTSGNGDNPPGERRPTTTTPAEASCPSRDSTSASLP